MTAFAATSILIASVLLLMLLATCAVAFAHGWQDGDQPDPDRHAWIPRAAYWAGGTLRRSRLDTARRELEEQRARTDAFYAALDSAVQAELHRKDQP